MEALLHMDMDAFFAAVEVRDRPGLEGRPVVVGADPGNGSGRGVVSTANYAAREYGIHSGMPVSEAYSRCPDAVFLPVDGAKYRRVADRIMACVEGFGDRMETVSIDEAFLKLTDIRRFDAAVERAERLQERIRREFGLTCSIGVASNRPLARIASDVEKPCGLTVVEPGSERAFLAGRPVEVIPGVGDATAAKLEEQGVETVDELAALSRYEVKDCLGSHGLSIWETARGRGATSLEMEEERKSLGMERTFDEDVDSWPELRTRLGQLTRRVVEDLQERGLVFGGVELKVRTSEYETYTRQKTLDSCFVSWKFFHRVAEKLLEECRGHEGYRLLGVRALALEDGSSVQARLSRYLRTVTG